MKPTTRTEVVGRRERWKSKPNQEELMTGKKPDPRARRVGLCESPRKAASPPKPSGSDALVQPSIGSGVPIRNFPLSPEIISYDDPTRPV